MRNMQPIYIDDRGVARFKENKLIRELVDADKLNLNDVYVFALSKNVPQEDFEQFWQMLGYSIDGYADLSFVSKYSINVADRKVKKLLQPNLQESEK